MYLKYITLTFAMLNLSLNFCYSDNTNIQNKDSILDSREVVKIINLTGRLDVAKSSFDPISSKLLGLSDLSELGKLLIDKFPNINSFWNYQRKNNTRLFEKALTVCSPLYNGESVDLESKYFYVGCVFAKLN